MAASAPSTPADELAMKLCREANGCGSDKEWRERGLWSIDTCNANSWTSAQLWLKKSSADLCVVQETKTLEGPQLDSLRNRARQIGWLAHPTAAHQTAASKASGGMLVAAKKGIGLAGHDDLLIPEGFEHRMAFAHAAAVLQGGLHIGSLWLKHSEGLSEDNLAILQVAAQALSKLRGPWVIGGDFNMPPEALEASGWIGLIKGVIVHTEAATCNGKGSQAQTAATGDPARMQQADTHRNAAKRS